MPIESCYFTRASLQFLFTNFDANFKNANKTLAVSLLKQDNLRLLLGTKIWYFRRYALVKFCMVKCYDFYGIFMTKSVTKNHGRCFVSLNGKPVQIMKSFFTVFVHSGMVRENKIKNEKSFL